jgi:hypothetical protein
MARADAPARFSLQGHALSNAQGEPMNGAVYVTFKLYESATSSTPIHTEPQTITALEGGFHTQLGTMRTLDLAIFKQYSTLFVGMSVEGDAEMTPRLEVTTAPYAGFAQYCDDAQKLQGLESSAFSLVEHAHSFNSLTDVPAGLANGDDTLTQSAVEQFARNVCLESASEVEEALGDTYVRASGQCQTNQTLKFSGSSWACANDDDAELQTDAVSSAHIKDGDITNDDVSSSAAIGYSKLNLANSIAANDLQGGSVTMSKIDTTGASVGQVLKVTSSGPAWGYAEGVSYKAVAPGAGLTYNVDASDTIVGVSIVENYPNAATSVVLPSPNSVPPGKVFIINGESMSSDATIYIYDILGSFIAYPIKYSDSQRSRRFYSSGSAWYQW